MNDELRALLDELDATKRYRGMEQRLDTTGRLLWMSPSEAKFHTPIEIHVPMEPGRQIEGN